MVSPSGVPQALVLAGGIKVTLPSSIGSGATVSTAMWPYSTAKQFVSEISSFTVFCRGSVDESECAAWSLSCMISCSQT